MARTYDAAEGELIVSIKQTDRADINEPNQELAVPVEVTEWPDGSTDTATDDAAVPDRDSVSRSRRSPTTMAALAGTLMVLALGALVGWLGVHVHHAQQADAQRAELLQAARQGAINLTSVDWQHVDDDVKRIIDSATGAFYEDFSQRAQPFIDVVRQVQSKTTGTVSMAGLESISGNRARALVAVTVETTNTGEQQPTSKAWRLRIDVQKEGNDVKIANVEFVP